MVYLYKECKMIPNIHGSNTNKNNLLEHFNPINNTKNTISISRKNNNIRNREKNLSSSNQENPPDISLKKQNSYFTVLNQGNLLSKFQTSSISLDDIKNTEIKIGLKKIKSINKRYNNYYIASDLLKHKYISDLISSNINENLNQPMRQTDDKINYMIKKLNIQKSIIKPDKIKYLSRSMICRFNFNNNNKEEEKFNKINTSSKNSKENKINIRLAHKKIGDNILLRPKKLSKNMFLYKKIFYYADKKKKIKNDKDLDNKYNILYSENENQYRKNFEKLNEIYRRLGKKKIYNIQLSHSQNKIKGIQERVNFMKKVVDYTYPDMVLAKIKEQDKTIYEKAGVTLNIITAKVNRNKNQMLESVFTKGLSKSFKIKKFVF